ncbi:hypothetical protein MRX96_015024 [Rhipicephalus microplus]
MKPPLVKMHDRSLSLSPKCLHHGTVGGGYDTLPRQPPNRLRARRPHVWRRRLLTRAFASLAAIEAAGLREKECGAKAVDRRYRDGFHVLVEAGGVSCTSCGRHFASGDGADVRQPDTRLSLNLGRGVPAPGLNLRVGPPRGRLLEGHPTDQAESRHQVLPRFPTIQDGSAAAQGDRGDGDRRGDAPPTPLIRGQLREPEEPGPGPATVVYADGGATAVDFVLDEE